MALTNQGNGSRASAGGSGASSGSGESDESPEAGGSGESGGVDLRFLQANERTFLAWIRTGIALMAFGFAVARISAWLGGSEFPTHDAWSTWTGSALLVLGMLCNVVAASRYARVRAAIIEGRTILPGRAPLLTIAVGLTLLGGLLAVHVVIH